MHNYPREETAKTVGGLKVSLGSGQTAGRDFLRVDLDPGTQPDRVMDIRELQFEPGSVDVLYASHVFEHLSPEQERSTEPVKDRWSYLVDVLSGWRRCLSENGQLYIAVPDLEKLARILMENPENVDIQRMVADAIYGGARTRFDIHYFGFTRATLTQMLKSAGFSEIQDFKPLFQDESTHKLLGHSISLNLVASNSKSSVIEPGSPDQPAEGRESSLPNELEALRKAADERLQVIQTLDKAAKDRLRRIQELERDLEYWRNTSPTDRMQRKLKAMGKRIKGKLSTSKKNQDT